MLMSLIAPVAPDSLALLNRIIPRQASFGIDWPLATHTRRSRRASAIRDRRTGRPARPFYEQQAIAFDATGIITPLMREIEKILTRIADVGGEMPNNPVLGERAGGRGRSSIDRAIRRLASVGRVKIENTPGKRRVFVVATGCYTDWGESRPGHRPFCSRAKGSPPLPPKPRQPESQPLPATAQTLPRLPSLQGYSWLAPAVSTGAAARCQWPMWEDGERPTDVFCGSRVNGHVGSWCDHHRALVFRPGTARRMASNHCG